MKKRKTVADILARRLLWLAGVGIIFYAAWAVDPRLALALLGLVLWAEATFGEE